MSDEENNKVVVPSSADSTIKPSDATRIVPPAESTSSEPKKLKTIKLKPLKTAAAPAPISIISNEETISMNRSKTTSEMPQMQSPGGEEDATVEIEKRKLKNIANKADVLEGRDIKQDSAASTLIAQEEDATVKIEKAQKLQQGPAVASPMPGLKQTIKLRPSTLGSNTAASGGAGQVPPAPMKINEAAKLSTPELQPEAKAVPLPEEVASSQGPTVSPKKTIKLTAKKPSAPTVKLDSTPSAPTVQTPIQSEQSISTETIPQPTKRTLKIKTMQAQAPKTTEPPMPSLATPPGATSSDAEHSPSIDEIQEEYLTSVQSPKTASEASSAFSTIAASISILALAFYIYQTLAHYKSLFR